MNYIVYTSNCGHTAEYARILGKKTDLKVYSLNEAVKTLDRGDKIIYLGWLFANSIKGYKKASRRFKVLAVCAVGLCDTGCALKEIREVNDIPITTELFTMQGGMDKTKLPRFSRLMINMLIKGLSAQKERSESDDRMLELLQNDANYVSAENTTAFMQWYRGIEEVKA